MTKKRTLTVNFTVVGNFQNIPGELTKLPHWVCWRRSDEGKKLPINAKTGKAAKSNDPTTWSSYKQALKYLQDETGGCSGIGFVLNGGDYSGVDLDDCRDAITGTVESWAREVIEEHNSYTEASPSGTGVHIFVKAKPSSNKIRKKSGKIELYHTLRYLTVTGDVLDGRKTIRKCSLASLEARMASSTSADSSDSTQRSGGAAKDASASGAAFARINQAWGKTGHSMDAEVVEAMARKIDHHACTRRDKEKGNRAGVTNTRYDVEQLLRREKERMGKKPVEDGSERERSEIKLNPYSNIAPEHLEYIWRNYIARGKLHHFAGNSTEGKSPVSLDLIACVTSPENRPKWPDETPNRNRPQGVLLLAGEDDPHDTIRPRLKVAKADASLVFDVKMTVTKNQRVSERLIGLDRDVQALLETARELRDTGKPVGLIVIDPISNYLGNVPMNREEKVREVLMQLVGGARELRAAIITIGHFNKREKGTDSLQRIMGAAAFAGVARFVYLFGPDDEDAHPHAHVMVQRRGVAASALRYRTILEAHKWVDTTSGIKKTSGVIRVLWCGKSSATAESVVDPQSQESKGKESQAAKLIQELLSKGPVPSKHCEQYLKQKGFEGVNSTRVLIKAKAESSRRKGESFYSWYLKTDREQIDS